MDTRPAAEQTATSDTRPAEGGRALDIQELQRVLPILIDLPRGWLVTVALAALVSLVDVTIPHDGSWTLVLRVSVMTLWIVSLAWLPSLLRVLAVLTKSIKVPGFEVNTGEGLLAALARRSPAPPGTVNAPGQQQAAPKPGSGPPDVQPQPGAADAAPPGGSGPVGLPSWTSKRGEIYAENHDLFLAHTLRPSTRANQRYDVSIYLVGAHGADPTEVVESAEFYLGKYWGDRPIPAQNTGPKTTIGMTTACYGPFLCLCRVVLKGSRQEVFLSRYVDFEMAWVFDAVREIKMTAA